MNRLPVRKQNRLKGYDYSQAGCYFITICSAEKRPIFSRISVGDAALGVPLIELTDIGTIIKRYIENIQTTYNDINLGNFVIMPNHVHLLITLPGGTPKPHDTRLRAASPTRSAVPLIINALKSLATKEIKKAVWQRGYYDHIIRDSSDYETKWNYIETNPARWTDDEFYIP
jgi:REP element-mobilizing transposase RayT